MRCESSDTCHEWRRLTRSEGSLKAVRELLHHVVAHEHLKQYDPQRVNVAALRVQ